MKPGIARGLALAALWAVLAAGPAPAQPVEDPDWPCVQRKVPSLSLGQMWGGPIPQGNWRDDPRMEALAGEIAARRSPLEEVGPRWRPSRRPRRRPSARSGWRSCSPACWRRSTPSEGS
jgi:hypothetical protein